MNKTEGIFKAALKVSIKQKENVFKKFFGANETSISKIYFNAKRSSLVMQKEDITESEKVQTERRTLRTD